MAPGSWSDLTGQLARAFPFAVLLFVRAPAFEPVPERFLDTAFDALSGDALLETAARAFAAFVDFEARAALPDSSSVWPG